jgi:apolipoprotein N-acyltransferase
MDAAKLKRVALFALIAVVFVLLVLTIARFFYWWVLATFIGLGVVLLYEKLNKKRSFQN